MAVSSESFWRWQVAELCLKSAVYRVNRIGAKTVPYGAPVLQTTMSVTQSFDLTYCGWLVR